jgi:hypothetical protein
VVQLRPAGVHFIGLNNVLNFRAGTLAALGDEQMIWLKSDLLERHTVDTSRGTRAHTAVDHLGTVGWGTADSAQAMELLRPFGSVTVLNGHIIKCSRRSKAT